MFAAEELLRKLEQRSNGLVVAAIVQGGLMAVAIDANATYLGVIRFQNFSPALWMPGLRVVVTQAP